MMTDPDPSTRPAAVPGPTAAPGLAAAQGPPAAPEPAAVPEPAVPGGIDPRGPRVGAGLSAVVLSVALLTGNVWVLAGQSVSFAAGSLLGVQRSPYGLLFRRFVRPRLSPPSELEHPAAPRFAQTVGLVVTGAGLLLAAVGVAAAVEVAAAVALVAAFLNSVFGLCLGCELYLLAARARAPRSTLGPSPQ